MADERPTRRRFAALFVLGWVVLALAACDGEDLSGLETLTLEAGDDDGVVQATWSQPYVGRLAVDYGLTNRSGDATAFRLRAQATTSGDPDDTACERLEREAGRDISAVPDAVGDTTAPDPDASLTVVREFDDVVSVSLPEGAEAGWIALRIPADGEFIVRADAAVTMTVRADDGTEILPLSSTGASTCAFVATERSWDLESTTWRLRIESPDAPTVRLWIEQACPDVRTVPGTCPGAAAPIVDEPLPDALAADGFISGRIHGTNLGIGDRVTVELSCADDPGCAGDLELFFVVTPLECRTDNDCTNAETCTSEAYCVRASRGCAAAASNPAASPPVAPAALLALAMLGLRTRRRAC